MDTRLQEHLEGIEAKVDLALEGIEKLANGIIEGEELTIDDIEPWKQRCRARAAQRRRRRRKT